MSFDTRDDEFFDNLCVDYYEKILRYCYLKLSNEAAARDCVQDVFLLALSKLETISKHPNPGGFLFQTAKNLIQEERREYSKRMLKETELESDCVTIYEDVFDTLLNEHDEYIDEQEYIPHVLSMLSQEKKELYSLYYVEKKSMREIAQMYNTEEAAIRMRYVRLRREIKSIVSDVAQKHFV